jgi:hypothetical protein
VTGSISSLVWTSDECQKLVDDADGYVTVDRQAIHISAPYHDAILELHGNGWSTRKIAEILDRQDLSR